MGRKYTEAQKQASLNYLKKNTDDIRIRVSKEAKTKERWQKAAEREGKSLQRFVIDAVENHIAKTGEK